MDVCVSHQYGAFFRVDHKRSTWNLQTFFDWKLRDIKPKETKYSNPITSKIGCSPETGNRKWSNWQHQYPTPCGTSLRSFVVHHLSSTALPSCTRPRRNLHLGSREKWRNAEFGMLMVWQLLLAYCWCDLAIPRNISACLLWTFFCLSLWTEESTSYLMPSCLFQRHC